MHFVAGHSVYYQIDSVPVPVGIQFGKHLKTCYVSRNSLISCSLSKISCLYFTSCHNAMPPLPRPYQPRRDVCFRTLTASAGVGFVWYRKKREQSVKQKILPELVHSKQHRNMQLRKTLALWYLGGRSTLGLTNYYPLKRTSPLRGRKPEKVTLCFTEHHHHHQQVLYLEVFFSLKPTMPYAAYR